jgi:hypothetical protein
MYIHMICCQSLTDASVTSVENPDISDIALGLTGRLPSSTFLRQVRAPEVAILASMVRDGTFLDRRPPDALTFFTANKTALVRGYCSFRGGIREENPAAAPPERPSVTVSTRNSITRDIRYIPLPHFNARPVNKGPVGSRNYPGVLR